MVSKNKSAVFPSPNSAPQLNQVQAKPTTCLGLQGYVNQHDQEPWKVQYHGADILFSHWFPPKLYQILYRGTRKKNRVAAFWNINNDEGGVRRYRGERQGPAPSPSWLWEPMVTPRASQLSSQST